jgi:ribosomal-protein-alanine N-acetyltransferase
MSAVLKPKPRFEPMNERDLSAVLEIERRIYAFPWTLGNFIDSLRTGYSCWVCRDGPMLVGYAIAAIAGGEAHLLNLSINDLYQNRGHGSAMLSHVTDVARKHGAARLFLEVRPSNEAGRRLYRRYGFRRIGIRPDYYPAPAGREDAWVLALTL